MVAIKSFLKTILYKPLFNALIFLVWLVPGHNVGWAIIILTTIIRLILLPSSLSAARQQKKMRDLQPEIAELQSKYKDDKQKQAQVLMEFYKKNKVNPLGSCLPLLVQLPILIILYYVFQAGLSTQRFDLLYGFIPRPEFIKTVFLGIDLAKPNIWILPVIAGALQFIQTRQIMPPTPKKAGDKPDMQAMVSKQMLYLMPIFTIFIAGRLPAALPLYWIITNIFTIGQQWWVFSRPADGISNPQKGGQKSKFMKTIDKINATTKKHGVEITVRRKGGK